MKNVLKQSVTVTALCLMVSPVLAGEMTKGTKSYQSRTNQTEQTMANAPEEMTAEDVANMAPAAGDTMDAPEKDTQKSLREDMRLPRKN